jgi:hypothetical protein
LTHWLKRKNVLQTIQRASALVVSFALVMPANAATTSARNSHEPSASGLLARKSSVSAKSSVVISSKIPLSIGATTNKRLTLA